jgi:hypothetical protein
MTDLENTNDAAAMPPASAGSVKVACWAVMWCDRMYGHYDFREEAEAIVRMLRDEGDAKWQAVPLYRSPTLTDAEREAVDYFAVIHAVDGEPLCTHADTLRGLLERLK